MAPTSEAASAAYTLMPLTPTITPGTGSYASGQNVTLATGTAGATIRYTLDGTEPTATSSLYAAPVAVGSTPFQRVIRSRSRL